MEHVTTQGVWSCEVVHSGKDGSTQKMMTTNSISHSLLSQFMSPSTLLSLTSEVSSLETQRSRALNSRGRGWSEHALI